MFLDKIGRSAWSEETMCRRFKSGPPVAESTFKALKPEVWTPRSSRLTPSAVSHMS